MATASPTPSPRSAASLSFLKGMASHAPTFARSSLVKRWPVRLVGQTRSASTLAAGGWLLKCIPNWYHLGSEYTDCDPLTRRERRRRLAERDAEILAAGMSAPSDLDELAGHSARTALDID